MTTIINTPPNREGSDSTVNLIIGVVLLLIVAGLFFVYVVPMIRNPEAPKDSTMDINIKLPGATNNPQP